jgi:hypothetical protein
VGTNSHANSFDASRGLSGYVCWSILYLLLLALARISLEADKRVASGPLLDMDDTTVFFLLSSFEAGRLISSMMDISTVEFPLGMLCLIVVRRGGRRPSSPG